MFHIIHNFRYPLGKHIRHPLKSFKCSPSFAYKFCSEKKNDRDENIDELINEK